MKIYTEEQVITFTIELLWKIKTNNNDTFYNRETIKESLISIQEKLEETPIELPSDEEIIGRFMNWFLKHYSTATIDGMFGYVNSMEQEVTIREILDDYFNRTNT